jgi:hypothetical protein
MLKVNGEEEGGGGDRAAALLRLRCGLVSLRETRPALRLHRAAARGGCVPDLGSVRCAYHLSNPRGGRSTAIDNEIQNVNTTLRDELASLFSLNFQTLDTKYEN